MRNVFIIDEALTPLFKIRSRISNICTECFGTGKPLVTSVEDKVCIHCNGSGFRKKCSCGSGILIGYKETFCVECNPFSVRNRSERMRLLLNENHKFTFDILM